MMGDPSKSEASDEPPIPGTYIFDGVRHQAGYQLNMFCKSLDDARHREAFRSDEAGYVAGFCLGDAQAQAVLQRRWLDLVRLGGNIYYVFKLAIFDGISMQHMGAAMQDPPMSVDDFRAMMAAGGRRVDGGAKKEARHG